MFAPIRVMVSSGAVNSVLDSAPVRTRSGAFTTSFNLAGEAAAALTGRRFTSLMISVTVLSVSDADRTHCTHPATTAQRRIIVSQEETS